MMDVLIWLIWFACGMASGYAIARNRAGKTILDAATEKFNAVMSTGDAAADAYKRGDKDAGQILYAEFEKLKREHSALSNALLRL